LGLVYALGLKVLDTKAIVLKQILMGVKGSRELRD
jgi:hypothetical protein